MKNATMDNNGKTSFHNVLEPLVSNGNLEVKSEEPLHCSGGSLTNNHSENILVEDEVENFYQAKIALQEVISPQKIEDSWDSSRLYSVKQDHSTDQPSEVSLKSPTTLTKALREVKICRKRKDTEDATFKTDNPHSNFCCLTSTGHGVKKENEGLKEKDELLKTITKISVTQTAELTKTEIFQCSDCPKKFRHRSHLVTHSRAHVDDRNYQCQVCGARFKTKSNLKFHFETHSGAPFCCTVCNKVFSEKKILNRHIRVVHRYAEKFQCDQCDRCFKSRANLSAHYSLHTGSKPYPCSKCSKAFVYKSTYVAHFKTHDQQLIFKCTECEDMKSCQHHSEARPWLCTVCGKGYPLKGTLNNHMKSHQPQKPHKCSECTKSFMKRQSLECHVKAEHRGERPDFMCDQCSQSYFNVFALKRHYLKHISERSFSCETCSKKFWTKDALRVHVKSHMGVRCYQCAHCGRSFLHKHSLSSHLAATHNSGHSPTRISPTPSHLCHICNKTFLHKYNLVRHQRHHFGHPQVHIKQVGNSTLHVL